MPLRLTLNIIFGIIPYPLAELLRSNC